MLRGNVLITGGAGFLGRGIMRRAARENWPCAFTVYSRDEQKQDVCKRMYPDAEYVLGDIRDTDRLSLALRRHGTLIHAAALKFVPEAEFNVGECIGINVGGTSCVIDAARRAGVETTVLISTDKAVEPINTYGLTKAMAERLVTEAARLSPEFQFVACRYGNVIGSTGSVVPMFKRQHDLDGYITLTDPNMTRFWLGIDDAVSLILAAVTEDSGTIVVPEPMALSVGALAFAVFGHDVDFKVVGRRPGEREHERLLTTGESFKCAARDGYYAYSPLLDSADAPKLATPFELRSDTAISMPETSFAELAADAETV